MSAIAVIAGAGLLPVIRERDPETARRTAFAAVAAGAPAVEVTLDTPAALETVALLADRGVLVGVGTVRGAEEVARAADAGAGFVVSPVRPPGFVAAARTAGVEAIPAVLTPSELDLALAEEPDAIKLFPAGPLGPGYLAGLRAIWPDVPILVTGGIGATDHEIAPWLRAGALAVGLGGSLGAVVEEEDRIPFEARLADLLAAAHREKSFALSVAAASS